MADHMTDLDISKYGTLYIIATPIGNMKDITINALETLSKVDKIFCEDTRVTSKLLAHHGINNKLYQYHDHSDRKEEDKIILWLQEGVNIALVSDAGTPLISDPGYGVVKKAIASDIRVIALPGPCAAVCALTVSGLPSNKFMFYGFLPATGGSRIKELIALKDLALTMIFFESARRLISTLNNMLEVFGNRNIAVSRELTKYFEETKRGNIVEVMQYYTKFPPKGEVVIVLEGNQNESLDVHTVEEILSNLLSQISLKNAVQEVSELSGIKKKEVYDIALRLIKKPQC